MKSQSSMLRNGLIIALMGFIVFSSLSVQNVAADKTKLVFWGSTTVQPIIQEAEAEYEAFNTTIDIEFGGSGSGEAKTALDNGTAQIGMASSFQNSMNNSNYQIFIIAYDGLAIIVHPSNTIQNLTADQVRKIYNGTITNWKDLGGADKSIVCVRREAGSGSNDYFENKIMMKDNYTTDSREEKSNQGVWSQVKNTPDAIGYVGLGYITKDVKALNISKTSSSAALYPTIDLVKSKNYAFARELYFYTKGAPNAEAAAFMSWLNGTEGSCQILKAGYVPLNDAGDCDLTEEEGASIPGYDIGILLVCLSAVTLLVMRKRISK